MSWKEQVDHLLSVRGDDARLDFYRGLIAERPALYTQSYWQAIDHVGHWGSTILIARGPEVVRGLFRPLVGYLEDSVATFLDGRDGDQSLSAMIFEVIDATNMFEILGFDVSPKIFPSFGPYLLRIEDEMRAYRTSKGLAGIALNDRSVWTPIAGHLPNSNIAFTPRATFGPNIQGLLAHLGMAREIGASFDMIEPAWRSVLKVAPTLFAADVLLPEGLMLMARVVHHHIGGAPLGSVADRFYEDLQRCLREENA